jgi:uncharacterized protein YegL
MNIFFLIDSSASMKGDKISLLNKGIRKLLDFFVNYSTFHSIEIYIGILRLNWTSTWLTSPSMIPISSYKFLDIIASESQSKTNPRSALQELTHILRDHFWTPSIEKPFVFLFSDGHFKNSPESFKRDISDTIGDLAFKIPVAVGMYEFPEYVSAKYPSIFNEAGRVNESMIVPDIDYNVRQLEEFLTDPCGSYIFPFRLVNILKIVDYCKRNFLIPLPKKIHPRLHVIIIADCSSSMKGDKIALMNKGIQDLLVYLNNFSRDYSFDPYIGIIRLSVSATWLTDPEIVQLSSFQFQELTVIEGAAQPSASFSLLEPFLEKIDREFPVSTMYRLGNQSGSNPEYPIIFFLSDGNFHESFESLTGILNSNIYSRCIRIPVLISKSISLPFTENWKVGGSDWMRSNPCEGRESSHKVSETEKDYNFKMLDVFRDDPYYFGRPIIPPVNILELKKINDFFKIPFERESRRDE